MLHDSMKHLIFVYIVIEEMVEDLRPSHKNCGIDNCCKCGCVHVVESTSPKRDHDDLLYGQPDRR